MKTKPLSLAFLVFISSSLAFANCHNQLKVGEIENQFIENVDRCLVSNDSISNFCENCSKTYTYKFLDSESNTAKLNYHLNISKSFMTKFEKMTYSIARDLSFMNPYFESISKTDGGKVKELRKACSLKGRLAKAMKKCENQSGSYASLIARGIGTKNFLKVEGKLRAELEQRSKGHVNTVGKSCKSSVGGSVYLDRCADNYIASCDIADSEVENIVNSKSLFDMSILIKKAVELGINLNNIPFNRLPGVVLNTLFEDEDVTDEDLDIFERLTVSLRSKERLGVLYNDIIKSKKSLAELDYKSLVRKLDNSVKSTFVDNLVTKCSESYSEMESFICSIADEKAPGNLFSGGLSQKELKTSLRGKDTTERASILKYYCENVPFDGEKLLSKQHLYPGEENKSMGSVLSTSYYESIVNPRNLLCANISSGKDSVKKQYEDLSSKFEKSCPASAGNNDLEVDKEFSGELIRKKIKIGSNNHYLACDYIAQYLLALKENLVQAKYNKKKSKRVSGGLEFDLPPNTTLAPKNVALDIMFGTSHDSNSKVKDNQSDDPVLEKKSEVMDVTSSKRTSSSGFKLKNTNDDNHIVSNISRSITQGSSVVPLDLSFSSSKGKREREIEIWDKKLELLERSIESSKDKIKKMSSDEKRKRNSRLEKRRNTFQTSQDQAPISEYIDLTNKYVDNQKKLDSNISYNKPLRDILGLPPKKVLERFNNIPDLVNEPSMSEDTIQVFDSSGKSDLRYLVTNPVLVEKFNLKNEATTGGAEEVRVAVLSLDGEITENLKSIIAISEGKRVSKDKGMQNRDISQVEEFKSLGLLLDSKEPFIIVKRNAENLKFIIIYKHATKSYTVEPFTESRTIPPDELEYIAFGQNLREAIDSRVFDKLKERYGKDTVSSLPDRSLKSTDIKPLKKLTREQMIKSLNRAKDN